MAKRDEPKRSEHQSLDDQGGMDEARQIVVEELRRAFIHAFGARTFEVWLGKDGLRRHTADEFAEVAATAMGAVLGGPAISEHVRRLHEAGVLAPPLPYDPHDW